MPEITVGAIIAMVTAVADAVSGICKVLLTPAGQRWLVVMNEDDAARRKALERAGQWLQDLFSGKLFNNATKTKP